MARVAVVDVGSNSVRLLVAEHGEPLQTVERVTTITRLGAGVDARGRLDDAALGRTLECLATYRRRWEALGAQKVRVIATSAVRDAEDRDRFLDAAAARTGVRPRVLSGTDEATTAFRGATMSVPAPGPYLVVDIGGGSTELILGGGQPEERASRQLGSVRLTERILRSDPPTGGELAAAVAEIDRHLEAVREGWDPGRAVTLVGVAGTVTTIAGLDREQRGEDPDQVHGHRLPVGGVRELTDQLAALPAAQRHGLGPIPQGRADVIVGGALILVRVLEVYGFDAVVVSEADILDGVAVDLLG